MTSLVLQLPIRLVNHEPNFSGSMIGLVLKTLVTPSTRFDMVKLCGCSLSNPRQLGITVSEAD